jgi:hypothetical protein
MRELTPLQRHQREVAYATATRMALQSLDMQGHIGATDIRDEKTGGTIGFVMVFGDGPGVELALQIMGALEASGLPVLDGPERHVDTSQVGGES